MSESEESVTSYSCPECGSNEWLIQNRIAPAAAYFDPKITHVECANCGEVDDATTCSCEGKVDE